MSIVNLSSQDGTHPVAAAQPGGTSTFPGFGNARAPQAQAGFSFAGTHPVAAAQPEGTSQMNTGGPAAPSHSFSPATPLGQWSGGTQQVPLGQWSGGTQQVPTVATYGINTGSPPQTLLPSHYAQHLLASNAAFTNKADSSSSSDSESDSSESETPPTIYTNNVNVYNGTPTPKKKKKKNNKKDKKKKKKNNNKKKKARSN